MKLRGRVWKDGNYWVIEAPALNLSTQGKSKKDALFMIADAIRELLEKPDYVVRVEPEGKDEFALSVDEPAPLLGLMLNRLRMASGYSVQEFADKLGMKSRNGVYQFESGEHEPSFSTLRDVLAACGYEYEMRITKRGA